jgi:mono/diheme cytochrome c family protein
MSASPGDTNRDDPALRQSLWKWQRSGAFVLFLLVLAFPIYLGVEGGRRDSALAARQAALVRTGGQLWTLNCASCHGLNGQGVDAPALNSKEFLQSVGDKQMHYITAAGIPGTEMPTWWNELGGPLTDEQIAAIVAYVRSWEQSAPSRPEWRHPRGS